MAADSDNESVLSSLPSSPYSEGGNSVSGEDEDQQPVEGEEEDGQEQEQGDANNIMDNSNSKDQSDADTEPLPPSSSAARRRSNGNGVGGGGGGTRRTILQTESSSSSSSGGSGDEQRQQHSRQGRDTLAVPSTSNNPNNTSSSSSSRIPSALASSTRRMSFDDGSDLSALTSEAEDAQGYGDQEEDEDDEGDGDDDDDDDDGNGNAGQASTAAATSRRGRQSGRRHPRSGATMSTRKAIGQRASTRGARDGDGDGDDEDGDGDDAADPNGSSASTSMDEEDENDDEDEDEDDDFDEEDEDDGGESGKRARARSTSHGRGRGRPPKRQNALAAAAKRAAAKSLGAQTGKEGDDEGDSEEDEEEEEASQIGGTKAKKEALPSDLDDDNDEEDDDDDDEGDDAASTNPQSRSRTKAERLGIQSLQLATSASTSTEGDDLDPDEQLAQDLLAAEEAELAEVAKHLDDSEDEDYLDSSTARGRALLSARRRKAQAHANATGTGPGAGASAQTVGGGGGSSRRSAGGTPKRSSARGDSTSLPPLSASSNAAGGAGGNSTTKNANLAGSPTSKNSKLLVGATSNGSLAKKRGAASAASKRGGGALASGAAAGRSPALQRHRGVEDDDHMDVDSQAQSTDHYDSDAATTRHGGDGDAEDDSASHHGGDHHQQKDGTQIIITDANGGELGPSSSTSTIPLSAKALSQAGAIASAIANSNLDADDAMSGISEDIPISSQARAQAQAALAAAAAAAAASAAAGTSSSSSTSIPRLAISTAHAGGLLGTGAGPNSPLSRDEGTPDEETTAPSTPMLPLPSSGFPTGASGRRRSPAPGEGGRGGRGGRGRGFARGRAKKLAQARLLAAQGDEDGEVSTSAAEDHDRELSPGHETGAGSDHEDDTGDAGAAKKRQEAIEALTKIEIEFAQLRDKMYLDKMEEIARERWQIENGVHPEHIHLVQLIEHRRKAKLELARKILKEAEAAQLKKAESEVRYCWSQWMHGRHELVHTMVEDMNHKRRRLDREKRAIERPRNEELTTILRMHAPPPYMFYEKKHPSSYGREYSLEFEVAENMQKKRKSGAVGLDHDEAMYDLERMGLRDPYRGTYPPHFHYDPAYAVGPAGLAGNRAQIQADGTRPFPHESAHPAATAGPSSFTQSGTGNTTVPSSSPANNPLAAAQGRTVASVSQHAPTGPGGRSDPFSAYRMQTSTSMTSSAGAPSHMHIQSPTVAPASRPASGPRPTLDDHLGYSTTGHARTASQSSTSILPGHERQTSRSQQRYDYTSGSAGASKGLADTATGANRFIPSYYAALGAQRS